MDLVWVVSREREKFTGGEGPLPALSRGKLEGSGTANERPANSDGYNSPLSAPLMGNTPWHSPLALLPSYVLLSTLSQPTAPLNLLVAAALSTHSPSFTESP